MDKKIRIWTSVTPELKAELEKWSSKLGVSQGQLSNMCIQSGIKTIVRAISPEDSIEPSMWAKISSEMAKMGELEKP